MRTTKASPTHHLECPPMTADGVMRSTKASALHTTLSASVHDGRVMHANNASPEHHPECLP